MDKRKWKQKNKRKQQQQQLALETKFGKKMILTMVTLNDQYRYGFQHIFFEDHHSGQSGRRFVNHFYFFFFNWNDFFIHSFFFSLFSMIYIQVILVAIHYLMNPMMKNNQNK